MPESPVKEVALTCFAEASYGCDEGDKEKRAITDVIYNRVNANERMWGYNTVTGVLSKKISFWAIGVHNIERQKTIRTNWRRRSVRS